MSIEELMKVMPVLSKEEERMILGGGNNDCVFQAISYILKQYNITHTPSEISKIYEDSLMSNYGWSRETAHNYTETMGVSSSHCLSFVSAFFSGNVITDLNGSSPICEGDYSGYTMAMIYLGSGSGGHAVIITGCVSTDDCGNITYSYYDPQNQSSGTTSLNGEDIVFNVLGVDPVNLDAFF